MAARVPIPVAAPPPARVLAAHKTVVVDTAEFVRTRDALTSAYLNLSMSMDRMVKAYLEHTQVVLNGDESLNVSYLINPLLGQAHGAPGFAPPGPSVAATAAAPTTLLDGINDEKKPKKRAYAPRDPNAPKRPLTAYFRYLHENRPSIAQEMAADPERFHHEGKPGDLSRVATERWNALTADQREPYKVEYREALKVYEEAMKEYKAKHGIPGKDGVVVDINGNVIATDVDVAAGRAGNAGNNGSDDDRPLPPPPPPASTKKTGKKSAPNTPAAAPTSARQTFSSISKAAPASATKPSSPVRKRKAADATPAAAPTAEEPEKKKRSRKTKAEMAAAAAAAAAPPAPAIEAADATPAEDGGKKKRERKRKSSGA